MKIKKLPKSLKEQIRAEYKPNKVTQPMLAKKYALSFHTIHNIIQQATCIAKIQRFDLDIEPKITKLAKGREISFNSMVNFILRDYT